MPLSFSHCGYPMQAGSAGTVPSYIATGSAVDLSAAQNPAYGANVAGDLFVMQVFIRHAGSYTAPTDPSGWTGRAGPNDQASCAQYIYTRDARSSGGESGTVTIPSIVSVGGQAVIHTFRNVAAAAFFEGLTQGGSAVNSTTIGAPSVTTSGAARLAVAMVGRGDDLGTASSFTGESGGDWTTQFSRQTTTGIDSGIDIQTANMASVGTISGGSYTPGAGYNNISNVTGFALVGV